MPTGQTLTAPRNPHKAGFDSKAGVSQYGCPILREAVGWASDAARSASIVVHTIDKGYRRFSRPNVKDLRQNLRAVTKKCRPDWDLTTPEMKKARQEGHKELFYPYDKTYAQSPGE